MTLSITMRRVALGGALLLAIVMTVVGDDTPMQKPAPPARDPPAVEQPVRADAPRERVALAEVAKLTRVPPQADGIDAFARKSWAPPRRAVAVPAPEIVQPVAPELPFRYLGRIEGRDGPTILLARDNESICAKVGEAIDNDYRLEAATEDAVTIVYVPLNERQVLNPEAR